MKVKSGVGLLVLSGLVLCSCSKNNEVKREAMLGSTNAAPVTSSLRNSIGGGRK
jgi:hypothetical protein